MEIDWSSGRYERTADTLLPASERAVACAQIARGERVIDVGCGTGNAAFVAARAGALVTGVDSAARLLEVAQARLASEGHEANFVAGEAGALPVADRAFDAALSVFAVIFAPDAEAAVAELVRVVRPGGRIVITSWCPTGVIAEAGRLVREALLATLPPAAPAAASPLAAAPPAWGDPEFIRQIFGARGARIEVSEASLPFVAASPTAWFEEQEADHPVWRLARERLAGRPDAWNTLRTRTIDALTAANEDARRFRATSHYLVARADRPG